MTATKVQPKTPALKHFAFGFLAKLIANAFAHRRHIAPRLGAHLEFENAVVELSAKS